MRIAYKLFTVLAAIALVGFTFTADAAVGNGATESSITRADQFIAGAGPAQLENLGANELSYQFFAGKFWELNRQFALKTIAEATTDFDNAVLASGKLGANFYPTTSRFSPYVGGAVGLGYAMDAAERYAFGMDLSASIGLMLFRDINTQVTLETATNVLLREFENESNPIGFSARVGILF